MGLDCDGFYDVESEVQYENIVKNQSFIVYKSVDGWIGRMGWKRYVFSATALPVIDALMRTDIDRVALTSMGNTITLEQQNGEWVEIAPLTGLPILRVSI